MATRRRRETLSSHASGRGGFPPPTDADEATYPSIDVFPERAHPVGAERSRRPLLPERFSPQALRRKLIERRRLTALELLRVQQQAQRAARKVIARQRRRRDRSRALLVQNPKSVLFCVRRKLRRELLFRLGVAGFRKRLSPGRGGRYRKSYNSLWRC